MVAKFISVFTREKEIRSYLSTYFYKLPCVPRNCSDLELLKVAETNFAKNSD